LAIVHWGATGGGARSASTLLVRTGLPFDAAAALEAGARAPPPCPPAVRDAPCRGETAIPTHLCPFQDRPKRAMSWPETARRAHANHGEPSVPFSSAPRRDQALESAVSRAALGFQLKRGRATAAAMETGTAAVADGWPCDLNQADFISPRRPVELDRPSSLPT